jgi:hypothetical protein
VFGKGGRRGGGLGLRFQREIQLLQYQFTLRKKMVTPPTPVPAPKPSILSSITSPIMTSLHPMAQEDLNINRLPRRVRGAQVE